MTYDEEFDYDYEIWEEESEVKPKKKIKVRPTNEIRYGPFTRKDRDKIVKESKYWYLCAWRGKLIYTPRWLFDD